MQLQGNYAGSYPIPAGSQYPSGSAQLGGEQTFVKDAFAGTLVRVSSSSLR
jgi:hypothetical protein